MNNFFYNPIVLIGIGLLLVAIIIYLLIKNYKFQIVSLEMRQKIHVEDALKFIFDCQYKEIPCTQNAIAGHLNVSPNEILGVVNELIEEKYIYWGGQNILLCDLGRSYALQVIRRHRLWESHLAQNSSVSELEWHQSADEREHNMTSEETELLAAQIGHPVMDPHGDPIPSKSGYMHEESGVLLVNAEEGDIAMVVHIEDEPHDIYKTILEKGIFLGQTIRIDNVSGKEIKLTVSGKSIALPLQYCQNLTVDILTTDELFEKDVDKLSNLKMGEEAEIVGLSNQLRGLQRRRLLDFGIVKGSKIYIDLESPFENPIGYRVLGTTLALRKAQAEMIFIKKV